jgi:hypothetical protein
VSKNQKKAGSHPLEILYLRAPYIVKPPPTFNLKGLLELPNYVESRTTFDIDDTQLFEHLRVGTTKVAWSQMEWEGDQLNPKFDNLAYSSVHTEPLDVRPVCTIDEKWNPLSQNGSFWNWDDFGYGPLVPICYHGRSDNSKYYDKRYDGVATLNYNFFNTYQSAKEEAYDALKTFNVKGGLSDFLARVPLQELNAMLPPFFGGTLNEGTKATCARPWGEPTSHDVDYTYTKGVSLEECIQRVMVGSYDPNLGINHDNRDMYARLDDASFSGAVFLAELPEMSKMIFQLVRLGNTLIKPSQWPRSFRKLRKAVGSAWLGYNFGVAPTISDMEDILRILLDFNTGKFKIPAASKLSYCAGVHTGIEAQILTTQYFSPFRRYDSRERYESDEAGWIQSTNGAHLANQWREIDHWGYPDVSHTCMYYTRPLVYQRQKVYVSKDKYLEYLKQFGPAPGQNELNHLLSTIGVYINTPGGREQLAMAIWEAIPFTWLLDYIVNVGDLFTFVASYGDRGPRFTQAEVSSIRFVGVEFGVMTQAVPYEKDLNVQYFPVEQFGIQEFRRCENATIDPDVNSQLKIEFEFPTFRQWANVIALLAQK